MQKIKDYLNSQVALKRIDLVFIYLAIAAIWLDLAVK